MILVTGAAGKTGRALICALNARGEDARALVHRPEQVRPVTKSGAREVLVGEMRDPTTMERATRNVRAVYHICPNVSPDELTISEVAIAAARSAGVAHFCYHSVLHPQTEEMPHHWLKSRVEEQLFRSGLNTTILQPTAYMQNVLAHWDTIVEQGILPIPYPANVRLSLVDLEDVATVAATVLTEPGHAGATYELVGTEALSQNEVATILSQRLGRPVRAELIPLETWERQAKTAGLGEYQVDTLAKMFQYYAKYNFQGNPGVLGWLLGRPPTPFADFVERSK